MGSGIAHVAALAGFDVTLSDLGQAELDRALEIIRTNLGRQARKGLIADEEPAAALERISTGVGLDAIKGVDMVIEAVVEDEAVKKEIFVALRGALPEHTIICTNSSTLPVTRLAASTDRPGKFMGMHFMNPAPMMELVELVRGIATEEETYEIARKVTVRMGKTPAMAEDFPAFIVNRILMPMVNEAIYALYEGVGNVQAIDTAMKLGRAPSDGSAGTRRFHRPRHLPLDHADALRGPGRQQVPALPAARQVRRGRLARPQGPARDSTTTPQARPSRRAKTFPYNTEPL